MAYLTNLLINDIISVSLSKKVIFMKQVIKIVAEGKNDFEIIQSLMKKNNGYITSKEVSKLKIHRMRLNVLEEKRVIEKVSRGIYIDANKIEDKYYVFSLSMPNTVFSHMTALYFHGLSIKAPTDKYDITVRKTYNSSHLKEHEVFYVPDALYDLGLIEVETPMGNKVRAYDIERCICDIIRSHKRMDSELVKFSIREYLKRKDKSLAKLSIYAEKMGIKKEVLEFVGAFYE